MLDAVPFAAGGRAPLESNVWLELPGRSIPIEDTCAIGRGPGNHVVLEHEHVSRHHALIRRADNGECWIIDLGSANGTYVNHRRVNRLRLSDGDTIAIGTYAFVFRCPPSHGGATEAPLLDTVHDIRSLQVWLFVVDIEGSTEISRKLGALEMEAVHSEWLARCRAVLRDSGGIFDKPLGDGFLAFWPAGESTAASVARALFDFKRLQSTGALPFRMVLHRGTAFAGGEIASGMYRLFGADIVFTFRMEALAKTLRVRCLLSAPARAGLDVQATSAGCHALPGLDGSHKFFTL